MDASLEVSQLGYPFLSLSPFQCAGSRGESIPSSSEAITSTIFSQDSLDGFLEAAFLLKSTGISVAAWTRNPVPQEVISVMAATLWGSLDTMIRTLGGTGPRSAMLETDERRILAVQAESNRMLLLVASRSVGKRRLRNEAQRILQRVAQTQKAAVAGRATIELPE